MKNQDESQEISNTSSKTAVERLIYALALLLVLVGLINVTPAIPGWDELWKNITGSEFFRVRRFPTEWLYPIVFFWMMLIVVLKHSVWRSWVDQKPVLRRFGLFLDLALVISAAAISLSYLIELEAVCPVSYTHLTLPTKRIV